MFWSVPLIFFFFASITFPVFCLPETVCLPSPLTAYSNLGFHPDPRHSFPLAFTPASCLIGSELSRPGLTTPLKADHCLQLKSYCHGSKFFKDIYRKTDEANLIRSPVDTWFPHFVLGHCWYKALWARSHLACSSSFCLLGCWKCSLTARSVTHKQQVLIP